jgi:hypothetical protein
MIDKLKLNIEFFDKKIQNNQKYSVLLVVGLILLIFVVFLLHGLQFYGPVIIADEVGYLAKALALSGVSVDAASSYHGGYSMLILPAFWLFHNPDIQWRAVLIINAFMWAVSAGLLYYFLKKVFPKKSNLVIASAVALSFCYPGFIAVSGYAYSNSGFVFVFMLSLAALVKSRFENNWYLIIFSILAGFLYWVHPLGMAFIVITILYFISRSVLDGNFMKYLLPIFLLIIIPLSYFLIIHPWFNSIMTPAGMAVRNHYGDFAINLPSRITHLSYWIQAFTFFVGQISFMLVATFGMVAFCAHRLFSNFEKGCKNRLSESLRDTPKSIMMIILASIILVAMVEALYFPADVFPFRVSMWIYGRYTEMLVLPVIGVGLLSEWRLKTTLWVAGIAIFAGVLLTLVTNSTNTIFLTVVELDISSFWPNLFIKGTNFLIWFLIGSVGILFAGFVGLKKKKWLLLIILPLLFIAIGYQSSSQISFNYHQRGYSEIGKIIVGNYKKGTCVGLDSGSVAHDGVLQYGYYSFHFSEFRIARMTSDEWLKKCDGPFLTYDIKFVDNMDKVKVVAEELNSGLYIVMREKDINSSLSDSYTNEGFVYVKYFIDGHPGCEVKGCMDWVASSGDLSFTIVGEYRDGALNTTGREGYLFVGPKVFVNSGGVYTIKIKGDFRKLDSISRLKVTSNDGKKIIRLAVFNQKSNNHEIIFQLNQPVDDLQIMIYVGGDADITLNSYEVTSYSHR